MKNFIWILLFCISVTSLKAQDEVVKKYMSTITSSELHQQLSIFASDEFEGRQTGTPGADAAALFLADGFMSDSLIAPCNTVSDPYFQPVELYRFKTLTSYVEYNNTKFNNKEDIFILNSPNDTTEQNLVFTGFGKNGKKFPTIEVKDKIVVMLTGEPVNSKGNYLTTGTDKPEFPAYTDVRSLSRHLSGRMDHYLKQGAKGFIILEPDTAKYNSIIKRLSRYFGRERIGLKNASSGSSRRGEFYAIMSVEKALPIFGLNDESYHKLMQKIESGGKFPYNTYTAKIKSIKVMDQTPVKAQNVAGLLQGSELKDEIIVVSAHYDHIGMSP